MTHPLVEALRDLDPSSREWIEARDRLRREDRDEYRRWLEDAFETDETLASIEDVSRDASRDRD